MTKSIAERMMQSREKDPWKKMYKAYEEKFYDDTKGNASKIKRYVTDGLDIFEYNPEFAELIPDHEAKKVDIRIYSMNKKQAMIRTLIGTDDYKTSLIRLKNFHTKYEYIAHSREGK